MWDAAGWQYYTEATHENWDKLKEMLSMASLFMEENSAKLLTEGFMPPDFIDNFEAKRAEYLAKYNAFDLALENAMKGTNDKITANNTIYDKIVSLCLDGQTAFKNDETRKKLFSMEAVSSLVKPTGSATVVVELKNAETGASIPAFDVTNLETERTVTADNNGRAEMGQQAEGTKNYRIVADGFPEDTISVALPAAAGCA